MNLRVPASDQLRGISRAALQSFRRLLRKARLQHLLKTKYLIFVFANIKTIFFSAMLIMQNFTHFTINSYNHQKKLYLLFSISIDYLPSVMYNKCSEMLIKLEVIL